MPAMPDRDFKGVWIPKEIWLDKNLTLLDKAIMVEIDSLDRGEIGCWAGNEHFAEMFGCTNRKVSDSVSKLIQKGYVKVIRYDGRRRFLRSCMKYVFAEVNNGFQSDTNKFSTQTDEIFQSDARDFLQSNPYSNSINNTGEDDRDFNTVQLYAVNNLQTLGYRAMEELNSFVDDLGEAVVRHAIDNALEQGVRNWAYVKKILNTYAEEGIKTVGDARAYDDKRKKKAPKGKNAPSSPRYDMTRNDNVSPELLQYDNLI